MVLAAGHFKETQASAIIEAGINIMTSVLLVKTYGLMGVAIGTLLAVLYKTLYLVWYLSKHIIKRELHHFYRHSIVNVISIASMILATQWIRLTSLTLIGWTFMAAKVTFICLVVSLCINIIFYPRLLKGIQKVIRR